MLGRIGDLVGNAKVIAGSAFTEFATALDDPTDEPVTFGPVTPHKDSAILTALGCDSVLQVETESTALRDLVGSSCKSLLLAATVAVESGGASKLISTVDAMQEAHDDEMRRFRLKLESLKETSAAEKESFIEKMAESDARIEELEKAVTDGRIELSGLRREYEQLEVVIKQLVDDKLKLTMEKEENGQLDGPLVKGLIVQLASQRDDAKLRLKTLHILADVLRFSEDERNRSRLNHSDSLAQQFLDFLQDEV